MEPNRRILCTFPFIAPNLTDFTVIPAENTLILEIFCSSDLLHSELSTDMLRHMVYLDQLDIVGCKLKNIPARFLEGLTQLRCGYIIVLH